MPEPEPPATPTRLIGFRIQDLAGLVVGYSLAAFLLRTFRSHLEGARPVEWAACALFFAWLGLALSGPFVLLMDRRRRAPPGSAYSGEEMAWLGIGGYFLAIALFVAPAVGRQTPWESILMVQWLVALVLVGWLIGRRRRPEADPSPRWTRRAARGLLWTWPVAWALLVLLAR